MEKFDLSRKNMQSFGLVLAGGFCVLALLIRVLKHKFVPWLAYTSLSSLLVTVCAPMLLALVYPWWMRLAFLLAWVNTRILLVILYYLVFAPVGICMRLFGADLLDEKLGDRESYWHKKADKPFCKEDYEKRF